MTLNNEVIFLHAHRGHTYLTYIGVLSLNVKKYPNFQLWKAGIGLQEEGLSFIYIT